MSANSQYQYKFIGRQDGLDQFHSLRSLREQKNALCIQAEGGLGKTRLLQQFIKSCRSQRRPWQVGPVDDEIIDFYYLENRTIGGLRRSIAERVGEKYFPRFFELDEKLRNNKKAKESLSEYQFATLQKEIELSFFRELKQALPKIHNYTVLLFDTFETVYNRDVGHWFLKEFLTHEAVTGYLIVFAGRPREFDVPVNVYSYELKKFDKDEIEKYFTQKKDILIVEEAEKVAGAVSEGRPLILDLIVHYVTLLNGKFADLAGFEKEEIEKKLVSKFLDARDPLHDVIQEMAHLRRRYTHRIFDYLHHNDEKYNYDKIKMALIGLPFVKYRFNKETNEDIFTLHDEFQDMISRNGGGDWKALGDELYEKVVEDWYETEIHCSEDDPYKDLLRAEQLTYIISKRQDAGIVRFKEYFEEIKISRNFDFNDMLWGELAGEIGYDQQAYKLMCDQANWLFQSSRYLAAAFWYEQITKRAFPRIVREQPVESNIGARLGHCYLRIGQIDDAENLWEYKYQEAEQQQSLLDKATFLYNLGHIRVLQGQWQKAMSLYDRAFNDAFEAQAKDFAGQILFVAARLRARQGEGDKARHDTNRALELVVIKRSGQIHHAQALIYAGDVYRYLDDILAAENYYLHALRILENIDGYYDWKILALSGLGASFNRRGILKREQGNDIQGDLSDQFNALQKFQECLTALRTHAINSHISLVLDRLADVYLEVDRLAIQDNLPLLELIEEESWHNYLRDSNHNFTELDYLGKAHRLFDVAFLEADKQNDMHYMFDSLARAASVAQLRGRNNDLEYYSTLAGTLRGLDDPAQETILLGFIDLLKAHSLFKKDPESGIKEYGRAAIEVANGGSFGEYLVKSQFLYIKQAIFSLPTTTANEYCEFLANTWVNVPILSSFIQALQDLL